MLEFILFQWIQAFNSYKPSYIHISLCDGLTFSVDTTQEAKGLQENIKQRYNLFNEFVHLNSFEMAKPQLLISAVTVFPHEWAAMHMNSI